MYGCGSGFADHAAGYFQLVVCDVFGEVGPGHFEQELGVADGGGVVYFSNGFAVTGGAPEFGDGGFF